jgi:hypothetical protein
MGDVPVFHIAEKHRIEEFAFGINPRLRALSVCANANWFGGSAGTQRGKLSAISCSGFE